MTGTPITDTDIIIIGAGTAGLSAAKTLAAQNIPFVVLEASHRIGGRAYSEAFAGGGWFDLGCSYMHEGEINPLVEIAAALGIALGDGTRFNTEKTQLFDRQGRQSAAAHARYMAFQSACGALMRRANAQSGIDTDIGSLLDWDDPQTPVYAHLMASMNGSDVTDQSVCDHLKAKFGLDYPVHDGLGNLIARWGGDVPVALNRAVRAIDWRDGYVEVTTNSGKITGKKVLITVSTNILTSGAIRFTPNLPDAVMSAAANLPCGVLNKIGLSFVPGTFAPDQDGAYVAWPAGPDARLAEPQEIAGFDLNFDSGQQAIIFAGGSFGIYLERQGPAAMRDYALSCVAGVFGASIIDKVTDSITTAWHSEPLTLGAYSYAKPGYSTARQTLCQPIEDTVFLAGEAASITHYATCHGAFISGRQAALEMLARRRTSSRWKE